MNNKGFAPLLLIVIVIAAGAAAYFVVTQTVTKSPEQTPTFTPTASTNPDNSVFCTQDAKLCPDGSYVGRTGPKCEFAPCPTPRPKPSVTATPRPSLSPTPSPTVIGFIILSPSKSDQEWKVGTTHDIRWQNAGNESTTGITVALTSTGSGYCTQSYPPHCYQPPDYVIATNVANNGTYSWSIPTNLSTDYDINAAIEIRALSGSAVQETYSATIKILR